MVCDNQDEEHLYYYYSFNVFNDDMFHQFVSFTSNDNSTAVSHKMATKHWILSGGFFGIFSIPLAIFGVMTNSFLIFILARFIKYQGKQQLYGIALAIVYLFELIFNLLMLDYLGNGRVWLRNKGIYLDQHGPISCKLVHYLRQTLTSFEINLVFLESFFRYISIQAYGRFTPSLVLTIYTIVSALVVSFIMSAPTFIVNNIWRLDFRYYCGADPEWSSMVIKYYLFHRTFLVEGIFQSFLIIIFNILTFFELRAYKSLSFILEKAIQDTQINADILTEIRHYVHDYCDETVMILSHTTISALFCIPRSLFFLNLVLEIYLDPDDNTLITGVLEFYRYCGYYNLQFLFYYVFVACYFWIYFFTMQSFRHSIRIFFMNVSNNNPKITNFIDLFMLGDSLIDHNYLHGSSNLFEQLDAVTLQRLQHLENKNENNIRKSII